MLISEPLLPPKAGYVEVVDENGNHVYKATAETEAQLKREEQQKQELLDTIYDDLATAIREGVNEV